MDDDIDGLCVRPIALLAICVAVAVHLGWM